MRGLHRLSVCLVVLCGASAQWRSEEEFIFLEDVDMIYRRANDESCSLCSGDQDCITVDNARCNYYNEMAKILTVTEDEPVETDPDPVLRVEVDSMLFNIAENTYQNPEYSECIPLVSRFTDCTKENICLGCKSCKCDTAGKWNCTIVRQCRPIPLFKLDHHALLVVIDNLRQLADNTGSRNKRSINEGPEKVGMSTFHVQLSEWLNSVPVLIPEELKTITETNLNVDNNEADNSDMKEPSQSYEMGLKIPPHDKNEKYLKFISNEPYFNPGESKNKYAFTGDSNRLKRSISNTIKTPTEINKMTFEELTEWLNDMHASNPKNSNLTDRNQMGQVVDRKHTQRIATMSTPTTNAITLAPTTVETTTSSPIQTLTTTTSDQEILAFDEVLSNIIVDNHNYSRRKPLLDTNHTERLFEHDYMYDDDNVTFENSYEYLGGIRGDNNEDNMHYISSPKKGESNTDPTNNDVTESLVKGVTEVVIDLLESAQSNDRYALDKDKDYILEGKLEQHSNYGAENNIDDLNAVNLMKRDITYALNTSLVVDITTTAPNQNISIEPKYKNSGSIHNLKENVVGPLYNILIDKKKEIAELIKIKENLIAFLRDFNETDHVLNINDEDSKTKSEKKKKKANSFISIYELVSIPHIHDLEIRNDTDITDKYIAKLRNDVYEVIKDIVFVQNLYSSDQSKIPDDMKFLISSMKKFVHKKGFHIKGKKNRLNSRRNLEPKHIDKNFYSIRDSIIKIFKLMDKRMPEPDVLRLLSPSSRKILQSITKQYYVDEFANVGLRVLNREYNVTKDLKSVGIKWQEMTNSIKKSDCFDRIYHMKLLHLVLSADINKMNDALALIEFARSRRAKLMDETIDVNLISKIDINLKAVNDHIRDITRKERKNKRILNYPANWPKTEIIKRKKKDSFLKKIKNLLLNSKRDILKVLRKGHSKSEVLNELARKKLDALTRRKLSEYENTMRKWQNNLDVVSLRIKRSVPGYDKIRTRIKNIIPKYLRGKVHPAINAKKSIKRGREHKTGNNDDARKKLLFTPKATTTKSRNKKKTSNKIMPTMQTFVNA